MADDDIRSDDPFLERRLATLAALPVPERPTVEQLAVRGAEVELADGAVDRGRRSSHRSWLLAGAAAVVLLVLVSIAAVLRSEGAQIASGGMATKLAGQEYWSTSVTEAGVERPIEVVGAPAGSAHITLVFEADRIRATATCNTLNAAYAVEDNNRLVLGEIGSTQGNCVSPLWEQDDWLRDVLASGPRLALDGHGLTLTSGTTVIELVDKTVADPDRPLAGTRWMLTSVVQGDSVSSPPPMPDAWMSLIDDGSTTWNVVGSDGCNGFSGTIEVDGNRIGPMEAESTLRACGDLYESPMPGAGVLAGGATFVIEGSELRITKGDEALVYRADDGNPPVTETTIPAPGVDGNGVPGTDAPGTTAPPGGGIGSVDALLGPRWDLEAVVVDGTRTDVDRSTAAPAVWLQFRTDQERFTAVMDGAERCGEFTADVVVLDATIAFGPVQVTRGRACLSNMTPVDAAMQGILAGEAGYWTDGTTLTISNERVVLELRRA